MSPRLSLQTILLSTVMFTVCADRCMASLIAADTDQWESMSAVFVAAPAKGTLPKSYEDEDKHDEQGRQGSWRAQHGMTSDISTSSSANGTGVAAVHNQLDLISDCDLSVMLQSIAASDLELVYPERLFRPPKV